MKSYLYFSKIKSNLILRSCLIEVVGNSVSAITGEFTAYIPHLPPANVPRTEYSGKTLWTCIHTTSDRFTGGVNTVSNTCGSAVFKATQDKDILPQPFPKAPYHHFLWEDLPVIPPPVPTSWQGV